MIEIGKELIFVLYPFMTLDDNTEIVHSEVYYKNGNEKVKVCIEKTVIGGYQLLT